MLPLDSVEFYSKKCRCHDRRSYHEASLLTGAVGTHDMDMLRLVIPSEPEPALAEAIQPSP